jgi:hypothetical protein
LHRWRILLADCKQNESQSHIRLPASQDKCLKNSVALGLQGITNARFPIAPSALVPAWGDRSCAAAMRVAPLADWVEARIGDEAIVFPAQRLATQMHL